MPRQLDLTPGNLTVTNNPTVVLGVTPDQITNLFSNLPQLTLQDIEFAINQLLGYIDQVTGLDLTALANVLESIDFSSPEAFYTSFVAALIDLGDMVISGIQPLIDSILASVGITTGTGTTTDITSYFNDLLAMLGLPDLTSTTYDPVTAVENWITSLIQPTNLLLAPSSPLDAQNLYNQVDSALIGLVPYSHVGAGNPNLLSTPGFDTAASVSSPGWTWDATNGLTAPGCASAVANGSLLVLVSNIIPVAQGQTLNVGAWVEYTGLTVTSGTKPLQVNVAAYLGTERVSTTIVGTTLASPTGTSSGWLELTGNYPVPAGVDNIVVELTTTQNALSGTVKYDDAWCTKTGTMSGSWMSGIFGTVESDIQSAVDQINQAMNVGTSTGNPLSTILPALSNALTGGSPLNAQNLFNQVESDLLGLIPVSHIGNTNPNLLTGFDTAASVKSPGWSWNSSVGHLNPGCAQATANGTLLSLVSASPIQVTQNQTLTVGAWINYTGVTAAAATNPLRVNVAAYLGTALVSTTMVASIASPTGSSSGWVQMTGTYTVPAGVDNIVIQLQVTADATAGTIEYDDASATKTGLMSGNWMSGVSGTVAADIQSAVDQIFQSSHGGSSTGNALATILTSLTSVPGTNIVSSLLAAVIPTLDASKIITGVLNILQIPTSSLGVSNISDLGTLNDSVTNALQGLINIGFPFNAANNTMIGTTVTQATGAMNNIYNNVLNAIDTLQSLLSQQSAAQVSGTFAQVNFSNYPNGPLPSIFTVTYSGAGTSALAVTNGVAGWNPLNNDANRSGLIIYNVAPTNTDFQIIRSTMASAPAVAAAGGGGSPYIWALARVDSPSNPRNYFWVRAYSTAFLTYKCDVGCTVGGVDTIFLSGIPMTWSLDITVYIGVGSNPRRYQGFSGSTLIFDSGGPGGFTDTISQIGAGFRYWGAKSQMTTGGVLNPAENPGSISSCSVSDNAPPTVVGSNVLQFRAGGSTALAFTIGTPAKFPAAYFDSTSWCTPDMSFTGNAVTVSISASYTATIRSSILFAVNTGNYTVSPVIFKNNVPHRAGSPAIEANIVGVQAVTGAVGGTIEFYASAGDVIEPGYLVESITAGSITSSTGSGDATGVKTYFSLALTNKSLT